MTDDMWQTIHTMARELVQRECDPNEVQKALVYLRTHRNGEKFFRFLKTLVEHGRFLVRSRRTLDYYRAMLEVCGRYLSSYRDDAEAMCRMLGWTARLMRFYMAQETERPLRPRQPQQRRNPHYRR